MDFLGASAESAATLSDALKTAVSGDVQGAATAADALFEAAQTLRTEGALRRFLTDASIPEAARAGLVQDLFGGKVDPTSLRLLTTAGTARWTHGMDLPYAVEQLAAEAAVRSAGEEAERLSDELFTLGRTVEEEAGLRDALSDPARSTADKSELLGRLLTGKALPATLTLAEQALAGSHRTVTAALEDYQRIAGRVQEESVATVTVAAPLSADQESRLAAALAKRYGRPVHVNTVTDSAVLGGIKVEIGDDVIDGTVATRLEDAGRGLAG